MATNSINHVIQHLRNAVLLQESADQTDGQLLERFVRGHELASLEILVQRHSLMVWGVCRRLLPNHHDAEDAFQATFLVLVRKAASIVPRAMVGNWLYGVAHQTALKARSVVAKRRTRERQVIDMPEPETPQSDLEYDLQPLLDQELSRLPDTYRVAIVLCDLEGKSRKEAARQLGLPEGTVGSRLARARAMLAKRLARHGLAVSGGSLAVLLSQQAVAAGVPDSLVLSTIKAVTLIAAGKPVAAGVISAPAAALTEGVIKSMLLTKLRTVAVVLVVLSMVVVTCGTLVKGQTEGTSEAAEKRSAQVSKRPKAAEGGQGFQKLKLEADDLAEITGVNIYKFQLNIPKGQRFRVVLREVKEKDAEPRVLHQFAFVKESDAPTVIRVGFLRMDRKLAGFLLSEEKQAEYRIDCSDCTPGGIATIVPQPLAEVPPTRKTLFVSHSDKDAKQMGLKGVQLITVVASEPGQPAPPPTNAPRAELVIEPEK